MDFGNVGMMIFPIWSGKSSNSCSKPPTRFDEIRVIHIIWFSIYHLGIEKKMVKWMAFTIWDSISTIKEGFIIWVFHIAMGDCPFSSMIVIFFYRSWKLCVYVIFRNHIKLPEGNCLTTLWCRCVWGLPNHWPVDSQTVQPWDGTGYPYLMRSISELRLFKYLPSGNLT